jgi:hypothetical protein
MVQSKSLLLGLLCLFGTATLAQEITDTSFGKGMLNLVAKDSSWSVKFAPRIQFRANTAWDYLDDQYTEPQFNFLIRRARLKFDGFAVTPKLRYKIELGLSNRDIAGASQFTGNAPRYILDAVIKWNFYENFDLWVGQTKLPGNVERVVSSGDLQLIERSLLNSRFNIDRDVGFQLRHRIYLNNTMLIREKIAVSQGEGRNITTGNLGGLQYTGRLEFLPFGTFAGKGDYSQADLKREPTPKLMVAFTYDFNDDAVKTRSNLGDYMETATGFYGTDQTTIFADAMFKYRGFSFMGEYAHRDADAPVARNSDGSLATDTDGNLTGDVVQVGQALNLQAGYLFKSNYEVAGRYTTVTFDPIAGGSTTHQYTLGGSKYIVGHKLKVQSDLSYSTRDNEPNGIEFSIGFDLHF